MYTVCGEGQAERSGGAAAAAGAAGGKAIRRCYYIGWVSSALQAAVGCGTAPQHREPLSQFAWSTPSPPSSLNSTCSVYEVAIVPLTPSAGALCPASCLFAPAGRSACHS